MANCGDLFLRKQQADEELRLLNEAADSMAVKGRYMARINDVPSMGEEALEGLYQTTGRVYDSDQIRAEIEEAMGQFTPVNIGEGQPTNFAMTLARYGGDSDQVLDYAALNKQLSAAHEMVDPGDHAALMQQWGRDQLVDFLHKSYEDMGITKDVMNRLVANTAPYVRAVQKATEVRILAEGFKDGFFKLLTRATNETERGGGVTPDTYSKLLATFGYAVTASRHWDMIRRRTGQTLRSMGQQLEIRPLMADEIEEAISGAIDFEPDTTTGVPLKPTSPSEVPAGSSDAPLVPDPGALGEGTVIGEVVRLLGVGKSKPKQAAADLRRIAAMGRLEKLSLKETFANPADYYNHMALYGNSLAKDFMLTNFRSQVGLNAPSNALMALFKPVQQALENIGTVIPYGNGVTRTNALERMGAAGAATRDALTLTWARGRHLFLDSFNEGRNIYSSSKDLQSAVDVNTRHIDPNEIEKAMQEELQVMEMPTLSEVPGAENVAMRVALSWGKVQAAVRIKMLEAGIPLPYTRLGHRLASGADNVGGFFLFNFKLRNDLYMEARSRAGELGLDSEPKVQDWVDQKARLEFAYYRPTRDEILERRKSDPNIDSDWSDSEVGMLISDERTAQAMTPMGGEADTDLPGYWAPRKDSELANEAWRLSEEGRFSQQVDNPVLRAAGGIRGKWWGDALFPFWQIPLNGTLFDVGLVANVAPPVFGWRNWKNLTVKQRAKAQANWTIAAGLLGSFVALDAMDGDEENLVIGNGPVKPADRAAWLAKLRAQGRQPNTIAGIPAAGIPILNTLMLWRDIKENFVGGEYNKAEQANALIGIAQVLTSLVARTPGIAQIQQIQGLLTADKSNWSDKASGFAGFMAGSYFMPEVGAVRGAGRALGLNPRDVLRKPEPSQAEKDVGVDVAFTDRVLEFLKSMAYSAAPPLTALAVRQEVDHLGNRIRRPWGVGSIGDRDRFSPQVWPQGETRFYAELDRAGLLKPPQPLLTRRLVQVAMSPELQQEYLETMLSIKGDKQQYIGDVSIQNVFPRVNFKATLPIELQRGLRRDKGISLGTYPLGVMVSDFVDGRDRAEALRAAVNSKPYQYLMNLPESTPIATRREGEHIAKQILGSVDSYYQMETLMRIRASSSPAAQEWKRVRAELDHVNSIETGVPRMLEMLEGLSMSPVADPSR